MMTALEVSIMERIELAARRAVAKTYPDGQPTHSLMAEFASQIAEIIADHAMELEPIKAEDESR
jgi:hypothetical protein